MGQRSFRQRGQREGGQERRFGSLWSAQAVAPPTTYRRTIDRVCPDQGIHARPSETAKDC
eukprot:15597547-Heterocapsa_arctica.AAC.1